MKAGLYFSAAFTVQRMIVSELAYLALAPFLLSPTVNGVVYVVVGIVMSVAGMIVLRQNRYLHLHILGHHHEEAYDMETTSRVLAPRHTQAAQPVTAPSARWTIIHGFIAGFGFGGFSIFVNTAAAPAMSNPGLGFLPGLFYGLGTMLMLVMVGALFGASLRWARALSEQEIRWIGAQTGGRTLFFGGLLFGLAGVATLLGLDHYVPIDMGYLLIGLFMITIAIPVLVYSLRQVLAARKRSSIANP